MRLLLHIGHGKTGSSYLQSWLATNTNSLALQSGLLYPTKSSNNFFLEGRASQGRFSMGNGHVLQALLDSSCRPRRWRRKLLDNEGLSRRQLNGLVFSFEGWAKQLDKLLPPLLPVADCWDVERIELLLMVRDPLEHACSVYSQMVKRHGYTAHLEQWLSDYGFMARLLKSLEVTKKYQERIKLTIVHYGRRKKVLLQELQGWLELDPYLCWQAPPSLPVNRSLTDDELVLMRCLNAHLGDAAAPIGEALVDRLPMLQPACLNASLTAVHKFNCRWADVIERINAFLPESAALNLSKDLNMEQNCNENLDIRSESISLSPDQIDCLIDGLLEAINFRSLGSPG